MQGVREDILKTLSNHNTYLTITDISQELGLDRHTVSRHLDILEVTGRVRKIEHGNAKKYFINPSVPVSSLIDISSDMIFILEEDFTIVYINSAAQKKVGITFSSVVGKRLDTLHIDLFSSDKIINGLKQHSANKVFHTEISHSDGQIYSISILEISLEVGRTLIAITAEDITQRKTSEVTLVESEEKYRGLFQAASDPIFLIDQENGTIIDNNPASSRIYGYSQDEFHGMRATDFSVDPNSTHEFLTTLPDKKQIRYHYHKDGHKFPVEIRASLVHMGGRNIVISITHDISERLQAEELIHQSRLNFETFFNNNSDFLFVVDTTGYVLDINKTVLDRLGYTKEEIIGQPVSFFHPPKQRHKAEKIIAQMIAGDESFCPIPLLSKCGTLIPVETRVTEGLWNGQPAIFGVSKDVSQLTISEEKFSKAFHTSAIPQAISTFQDGLYVDVNEAFLVTLGYSRDEVIGKSSLDLRVLENHADRKKIVSLANKGHSLDQVELKIRTKNNTIRVGLFSASIIHTMEEQFLFTSMIDITDLRVVKHELLESELKYRQLMDSIPDGIWIVDHDGYTTYANPMMEQLLGYNPGEMTGLHLFSFIEEKRKKIIENNISRNLSGISYLQDVEILRRDGTLMPGMLRVSPTKDIDGQLNGSMAIFSPIGEKKNG